ncbi:hypothetical protein D3870_20605 [Noviherbaspirillum cavernae]|uniref:Uncharacterized protein n=1 Tax=Noviherbaspirillum cavernae TaxID=2320862 RepID=A0A418WVS1_9BURK|nr:hypothetical protein D3870_20605 [Noviherbaspirillum cavernae]
MQKFRKHALAESRRAAPALRRISPCLAANSLSGDVCSKPPFNEQRILPDGLHANERLPNGDADFPLRWSWIEAAHWPYSSIHRDIARGHLNAVREFFRKEEMDEWASSFWEDAGLCSQPYCAALRFG